MPPRRSRHQPLLAEQTEPEATSAFNPEPQTEKQSEQQESVESISSKSKGKGKETGKATEVEAEVQVEAEEEQNVSKVDDPTPNQPTVTMQDRMEKLKQLKQKMAASTKSNRSALLAEQSKHRQSAKALAAQDRKMARAEAELDLRDLKERGEDVERNRNWGYSIEDNEKWEDKLENKGEKRDKGAVDFTTAAARSYARQVAQFKPGNSSKKNSNNSSDSQALIRNEDASGSQNGLNKGYEALNYGDHKPDEKALERVIGHLNSEAEIRSKRSRKRVEDPDAEVNYINDKNKHFNAKVNRHFDQYTKEIRENFERGTAL